MTLFDLKKFLDTLMESFSACLEMELTIICANPIERVAATGHYRDETLLALDVDTIWKQSYTLQVIRTGKPMTIIDTSGYTSRVPFPYPEYYSLVLEPILLENRVEGVLVLASFTEAQQRVLIHKQDEYRRSLEKLAELISSKLEQQILLEREAATIRQLQSIMETSLNGLLLYRSPSRILQSNGLARQYLHFDNEDLSRQLLDDVFTLAESARNNQESREKQLSLPLEAGGISLNISAHPILEDPNSVLCMVEPFQSLQDTITQNEGGKMVGGEIIASSRSVLTLISRVSQAAKYSANILILGESGTGKELFARMIHTNSTRSARPFVSVNCAAIPETLLESELFGYEEGAFTGAKKGGRIGKFLLADGGTLFLDEIGDMPLYLQAKILRVLSDRKVDRIGGTNPVGVDVRIVAATNRNLEEMIANKEFREDLYYRLNVISFSIPPLRERREDILALTKHFIAKYNAKVGKDIHGITTEVFRTLMDYPWPGNVRELENCIEYMITFEQQSMITLDSVPGKLRSSPPPAPSSPSESIQIRNEIQSGTLKEILRQREREVLSGIMKSYGGSPNSAQVREICNILKISAASYYRKISELGIDFSQK